MKKILTFVLFITISLSVYSQKSKTYEEFFMNVYGLEYSELKESNLNNLVFYANVEDSLMTIFNPKTKKSVVYPFGQIPKKYFLRQRNDDNENPYFGSNNMIGCIYNGNYGFIDYNGNIIEPFVWDAEKYYLCGASMEYGKIIDKKLDKEVYWIEYRNGNRRVTYDYYENQTR